MSVRSVLRWLKALLFPPICRVCGERQNIFAPLLPGPICSACAPRWASRMAKPCPECMRPRSRCLCAPTLLHEIGCEYMVKLSSYQPGSHDVTERLLLRCKDTNDRALFNYLASELTMPAFRALQACGAEWSETVVCHVPRRPGAVLTVGHDQAAMLARALSRQLERPHARVLRRTWGGGPQKELSAAARHLQAQRSYRLASKAVLTGKAVLLVDDICTTGATLAACAERLYAGGARAVIPICIASTPSGESGDSEQHL